MKTRYYLNIYANCPVAEEFWAIPNIKMSFRKLEVKGDYWWPYSDEPFTVMEEDKERFYV